MESVALKIFPPSESSPLPQWIPVTAAYGTAASWLNNWSAPHRGKKRCWPRSSASGGPRRCSTRSRATSTRPHCNVWRMR